MAVLLNLVTREPTESQELPRPRCSPRSSDPGRGSGSAGADGGEAPGLTGRASATVLVTLPTAVVTVPAAAVVTLPAAVVKVPTAVVTVPTAALTFVETGASNRRVTGLACSDESDLCPEDVWDPPWPDPAHEGFPDPAEPRCVDPALADCPVPDAPAEEAGGDGTRAGPPLHRYAPAAEYAAPGPD